MSLPVDQSRATIRRLTDALYPAGKAAHYGTVQKLLEAKWLAR